LSAALVFLAASVAEAHTRRTSSSTWNWEGAEARVTFRFDARNLAELLVGPGLERGVIGASELERIQRLPADIVSEGVRVAQTGVPCELTIIDRVAERRQERLTIAARVRCPQSVAVAGVTVSMWLREGPGFEPLHLMMVHADGRSPATALGQTGGSWTMRGAEGAGDGLSMVWVGVAHIFSGYDHLAFLLTLIFSTWLLFGGTRGGIGNMLVLALAFTIGHSLTLAIAVLGAVPAKSATVELIIALSVVGLAAEGLSLADPSRRNAVVAITALALAVVAVVTLAPTSVHATAVVLPMVVFIVAYLLRRQRSPVFRSSVALAFGLVHGLGFAGALTEIGWQGSSLIVPLLTFNLGVELGQVVVITVVVPVLLLPWVGRHRHAIALVGCGLTMTAGAFWTGMRLTLAA